MKVRCELEDFNFAACPLRRFPSGSVTGNDINLAECAAVQSPSPIDS